MRQEFRYQGRLVVIPKTVDAPKSMLPGGMFASLVQGMLDRTPPWDEGDDPIESDLFDVVPIYPAAGMVLPGDTVYWAVHKAHKARNPGLSPFIDRRDGPTGRLTIELFGTVIRPVLGRAYGGEYMPPLPWMSSAKYAYRRGIPTCLGYWRKMAYYSPDLQLARPDTITTEPPNWFRAS